MLLHRFHRVVVDTIKEHSEYIPVVSSVAFLEFTGYAGGQKDENVVHYSG